VNIRTEALLKKENQSQSKANGGTPTAVNNELPSEGVNNDKPSLKSARTEISNAADDFEEIKSTKLKDHLYWNKRYREDLDEETVQKRMEQLWKYTTWRVKKWVNKYKKYCGLKKKLIPL